MAQLKIPIHEARELRNKTEAAIMRHLQAFEAATGCEVNGVELSRNSVIGAQPDEIGYVMLDVELGRLKPA